MLLSYKYICLYELRLQREFPVDQQTLGRALIHMAISSTEKSTEDDSEQEFRPYDRLQTSPWDQSGSVQRPHEAARRRET